MPANAYPLISKRQDVLAFHHEINIHCLVSNGPVRDAHLKWPNEPKVGDALDFPGYTRR
jgi:hypothetical protein